MPPRTKQRRRVYGGPAAFLPVGGPPPGGGQVTATGAPQPGFAPFWLQGGQTTPPPPAPVLSQIAGRGMQGQQMGYLPTITRTGRTLPPRTPAPRVPTTPAFPYLPTTLRTPPPTAQPGTAGTAGGPWQPPHEEMFGWWTPEQQAQVTYAGERQYAPPGELEQQAITPPAGGGGGGGGGRGMQAPPGVDPGWYAQFQREHGGQTPEQFYGQTGEGLAHAMADKEWSEGFARMYGRPPSEHDWRAHWFSTRVGYQPGENRMAGMTPRQYERWQRARKERRRAKKREQAMGGKEERRPPVWMPPAIVWR